MLKLFPPILQKIIRKSKIVLFSFLFIATAFGASQITLQWEDRSSNEIGFKIERKIQGGEFVKLTDVPANTNKYVDVSVKPGIVYLYRVQAFNKSMYTSYTNTAAKTAPNTPPKIAFIVGRTIPKNTNSGRVPLVISDEESPLNEIQVAATSDNQDLMPNSRIVITREPNNGPIYLVATPAYNKSGKTEITVRVSDGVLTWSSKFTLTVKE